MNHSILSMQEIEKQFRQGVKTQYVLRGVDVLFEQGKSYSIKGVSGSGKSTLLHILGGLDFPTNGRVLFDDADINKLNKSKKEKFLNRNIGFVFQFHYLIRELSVLENVMIAGLIGGQKHEDCKKRGRDLLDELGLKDKVDQYPFELSGGEQQRVSIIRAIFNKPKFILADEPTGDLDAANAEQVVSLLKRCQKEWDLGLVVCSHDKSVYEGMEKAFELREGILHSC